MRSGSLRSMPRRRVSKSNLLSEFCCVTSCTYLLLPPKGFARPRRPTARGAGLLRSLLGTPLEEHEDHHIKERRGCQKLDEAIRGNEPIGEEERRRVQRRTLEAEHYGPEQVVGGVRADGELERAVPQGDPGEEGPKPEVVEGHEQEGRVHPRVGEVRQHEQHARGDREEEEVVGDEARPLHQVASEEHLLGGGLDRVRTRARRAKGTKAARFDPKEKADGSKRNPTNPPSTTSTNHTPR